MGNEPVVQHRRGAEEDDTTGLVNYRSLLERVDTVRLAGEGRRLLIVIDLFRFRHPLSYLGIPSGDQVLRDVAQRLTGAAPASAVVARVGGDEYGLLLPTGENAEADRVLCETLRAAVRRPLIVRHLVLRLEVSIGCHRTLPDETAREAMQAARAALADDRAARLSSRRAPGP
jgi:diguanylate cyclase (GGDEF)-like protein